MIRLIVVLLFVLLLGACHSIKDKTLSHFTPVAIVEGVVSDTIWSKEDTSVYGLVLIDYSFLLVPSRQKETIDSLIITETGALYEYGKTEMYTGPLTVDYIKTCITSFKEEYALAMEESIFSSVWSAEMTIDVDTSFQEYTNVSFSVWSYTGGAHGNFYSNYYTIDKSSGRVLELEDVFTDLSNVESIVEPYFRKVAEIPDNQTFDEAGLWFENNEFYLPNNFYIQEETILFHYNTYEVGPYAAGEFEVKVPLSELKTLLR